VVHGVEVEILEGVEAVGATGDVVVATPDLDHVDRIIVSGRPIPVLPLPAMQVLLDATGNRERAAMIAKVLSGRSSPAGRPNLITPLAPFLIGVAFRENVVAGR
jgi:hypothetical protein